jgi:hypothetical protein
MLSKNKIKIAIRQLKFAGNEHDRADKTEAKGFHCLRRAPFNRSFGCWAYFELPGGMLLLKPKR